jgi:hypothetical protein
MKYEALIGDNHMEISADSDADAVQQAREQLAKYAEARFADARKRGRYIDVAEIELTADLSPLTAEGDIDYDGAELTAEITVAVPADVYRAA